MAKKQNKQIKVVLRKPTRKTNKKKKSKTTPTRLGSLLRSLGGLGGTALGGIVGMPGAGGNMGTSIGASLSKWLGSGDYAIQSNSLVNKFKSSGSIPMMHQSGQSIVVRHKEFVCDVYSGGSSFSVRNQFPLNPGLERSFPWLSTIAQNFQEYSWKGVIFHFCSTYGDSVASTDASMGTVMMHTNYRATEATPSSKVELCNEYFASTSKPSESFVHPIECNPKENPYQIQYVRSGVPPAGEDLKTYDLGNVTIATQGIPNSTANLGELWVSYEVELKKPRAAGFLNEGLPCYNTTIASIAEAPAAPFGSYVASPDTAVIVENGLGLTFSSGNTLRFPQGSTGDYVFTYRVTNPSGITITTPTITYLSNVKSRACWGANLTSWVVGPGDAVFTAGLKIVDPSQIAELRLTFATMSGLANVGVAVWQASRS